MLVVGKYRVSPLGSEKPAEAEWGFSLRCCDLAVGSVEQETGVFWELMVNKDLWGKTAIVPTCLCVCRVPGGRFLAPL